MHKSRDVPRAPSEHSDAEYYKALAHLSEERARETRRISALERARLEERLLEQEPALKAYAEELERLRNVCERLRTRSERAREKSQKLRGELAVTRARLKALKQAHRRVAQSRAHHLAEAYVRFATGRSLLARALRHLRPLGRALNKARRTLT